ncbi:MAG TPA: hypothetical protein VLG76_08135 [Rhabdochlamydiaceae bacterium]|nr:hypothetical protein [Rhabdochlamydiaceae bacterium]
MKKLISVFLASLICGSAAFAADSQGDSNSNDRTWSDGRPMSDQEYDHMQDVLLGGD